MPSLALLLWSQSSWGFMSKSRASQIAGKFSIVELQAQQLFKHLKIIHLDCNIDSISTSVLKLYSLLLKIHPALQKNPTSPKGECLTQACFRKEKSSMTAIKYRGEN